MLASPRAEGVKIAGRHALCQPEAHHQEADRTQVSRHAMPLALRSRLDGPYRVRGSSSTVLYGAYCGGTHAVGALGSGALSRLVARKFYYIMTHHVDSCVSRQQMLSPLCLSSWWHVANWVRMARDALQMSLLMATTVPLSKYLPSVR